MLTLTFTGRTSGKPTKSYKKAEKYIYQELIGNNVQRNPFRKDELILLSYDGDNLNNPTGFYPDYDVDNWIDKRIEQLDLTENEIRAAEEILSYLLEECLIADWNVWN